MIPDKLFDFIWGAGCVDNRYVSSMCIRLISKTHPLLEVVLA